MSFWCEKKLPNEFNKMKKEYNRIDRKGKKNQSLQMKNFKNAF